MNGFIYEKDTDNIVTITMDMSGPVNTMNQEFKILLGENVERLEKERDTITGVILTSAKKTLPKNCEKFSKVFQSFPKVHEVSQFCFWRKFWGGESFLSKV